MVILTWEWREESSCGCRRKTCMPMSTISKRCIFLTIYKGICGWESRWELKTDDSPLKADSSACLFRSSSSSTWKFSRKARSQLAPDYWIRVWILTGSTSNLYALNVFLRISVLDEVLVKARIGLFVCDSHVSGLTVRPREKAIKKNNVHFMYLLSKSSSI